VTASAAEHPDLFWAFRGGGNFGVVTDFELRLSPVSQVLGGELLLPASREVLRGYLDSMASAPDDLTTIASFVHAPPAPFVPSERVGEPALSILVCWTGGVGEGGRALASLRAPARGSPSPRSRNRSVRNGALTPLLVNQAAGRPRPCSAGGRGGALDRETGADPVFLPLGIFADVGVAEGGESACRDPELGQGALAKQTTTSADRDGISERARVSTRSCGMFRAPGRRASSK
jgi:hypothetical protein